MTVSIIQQDMTADERPESRYDCVSCFLDRQLQNKLLEHDEVLEANELFAKLNGSNEVKNVTPKALMSKAESITGWITDSKLVLRKPDKESNSNTSNKNLNGYQQWKDNRNKLNGQESYVFKHYCDTHGYIEQYRRDHTNVFIYKSPTSIQNMQGEGVQRYGQQINNTPAQITSQQNANICNHCNVSNAVPNYISTTLHYTNRCNTILGNGAPYAHSQYSGSGYQVSHTSAHQNQNSQSGGSHRPSAHGSHSGSSHHRQHQHSSACKKHKHHVDSASQAFKYKLAPETYWGNTTTRSDSQNSSESEKTLTSASAEMKTPRIGSGKGGKSPTKVTVPSIQNQLQNVSVAWRLPRQNTQIRTQDNTSTPMRTLDTLACVAADKQKPSDELSGMQGLTWCEKLELLRSVNKRKVKPKSKPQKLTYFKDIEILPKPLVREATRTQLYEQRRIKHLLQQARMKGFKQFDWLTQHESPRFRHSNSPESSSDSDSDCADHVTNRPLPNRRMAYSDGAVLSRYNMKKSVKGDNRSAVPSINRTNTEVFRD